MTGAPILIAGAEMPVAAKRSHIGMLAGVATALVLLAAAFWFPMH